MKPLKLSDLNIILPFLDKADYEGYNSNFVTMMMWNHEYHIEYEIHDHFCIMLHNYKGHRFFAMPFASHEYYKEAIEYMIDYAKEHHFPFMIDCAVPSFVEKLKKVCPGKFVYEHTRDLDDYVYDKEKLITLSGKKMQKMRNNYHNFISQYPDYEYRTLNADEDMPMIFTDLLKWERGENEQSESLTSEVFGIMYLLSTQDQLPIKIGGIFINDELKAFMIGSPLKHETIQIHIEKADKTIRGLYVTLRKEFLEHECADFKYVNREEDMGIENLRISKERMHPCKMVEKSRIYINDAIVDQANDEDIEDIKEIWMDRFEDEDEISTEFYFKYRFKIENTYVVRFKNQIVSALQIVPFKVKDYEDSYFILGVSTRGDYEGQGFMKLLMNHVLEVYKGKRIYLQAYHPEIYVPFGFKESHRHILYKLDKAKYALPSRICLSQDISHLYDAYNLYVRDFSHYLIRDEDYFNNYLRKRCAAFNDSILTFKNEYGQQGYMIYNDKGKFVYISEFIYSKEYLDDILKTISVYFYKDIRIETDCMASIHGEKTDMITMMCNQEDDIPLEKRYINEIY